jgi:hypothetical protein
LPSAALARLNRRLGTAHRQFQVKALVSLNPGLVGRELERAVARETLADHVYVEDMRRRLAEGVSLVDQDPTLSSAERSERYQALEKLERHYLTQHIEAAAWRMKRDAEISELKELGEPGGVWLLGDTKNHTADCLAMANRYWRWPVLEAVRPSNRHNGCDCRVVSRASADRAGIPWKIGYRTPAMRGHTELTEQLLREAKRAPLIRGGFIYVPLRPGVGGNPLRFAGGSKGGQFAPKTHVRIPGELPREMRAATEEMLSAGQVGDFDTVDEAFERAKTAASKVKDPEKREEGRRTLSRIRAAVVNPEGRRVPMGTRVNLDGDERGVPIGVPAKRDPEDPNDQPWTDRGGFAWFIPETQMPAREHADYMAKLRQMQNFSVRKSRGGLIVETSRGLDPRTALAAARELEIRGPALRFNRIVNNEEALGDSTPLDLSYDEVDYPDREINKLSRYPETPIAAVGIAGETIASDVRDQMVELGILERGAEAEVLGLDVQGQGSKESPIDWVLGDRGLEVKSEAFAGMRAFLQREGGFSISKKQGKKKRAWCKAHKKKPALAIVYVDLHSDTAHVFYRQWGKNEETFTAVRPPADATRELLEGRLRPGDAFTPTSGPSKGDESARTIFVGSFPLRYSPHRTTVIADEEIPAGVKPDSDQMVNIMRARRNRFEGDVGPSAPVPAPRAERQVPEAPKTATEKREERDREVIRRAEAMLASGAVNLSELSRQLQAEGFTGVSQGNLSKLLAKLGRQDLLPGASGVRTDLKRRKGRKKK